MTIIIIIQSFAIIITKHETYFSSTGTFSLYSKVAAHRLTLSLRHSLIKYIINENQLIFFNKTINKGNDHESSSHATVCNKFCATAMPTVTHVTHTRPATTTRTIKKEKRKKTARGVKVNYLYGLHVKILLSIKQRDDIHKYLIFMFLSAERIRNVFLIWIPWVM